MDIVQRFASSLSRRAPVVVIVCALCAFSACAIPSKPTVHTAPSSRTSGSVPDEADTAVSATEVAAAPAREPVIVPGSGRFVAAQQEKTQSASAAGSGFQLNFVDTEIATVVGAVIGDGLDRPFSVDPQVRGTMTLQAARPLSAEELLPALESALALYGFSLVEKDGTFHVVPRKDAPRRVSGLRAPGNLGADRPGYAVQIVPIKYVSVHDIVKMLQPFTGEGGILESDESRNLLIIAGSSEELASMQEVIDTFDVDWLTGMSFALFPVEYVEAETLADELETVFAGEKSPIANVVRIVPLQRVNSLMVVTHEASYLKQVERWIKRLDIGESTPGRRIYVYDVQNNKADDLSESLNRILSLSDSSGAEQESVSAAGWNGGATRTEPGLPSQSYVSPQQPSPESYVARGNGAASSVPGALRIVPSSENNALLIYANPSEFAMIEAALKRLDTLPIQILLEASLAEVTLNDGLRFGLQWSFLDDDGQLVLSEAPSGNINPQFPGLSYLFTGKSDIRAVLNAIETITDVDVISSPKLMVLNNHQANLQIGDQVPITVQSSVSTDGGNAPVVNSVQLRDTGVILNVTPRANKSGLVLLDISQEVSDVVATTSSNIDSPTIQQRKISSTIAVRDGETIALGGLIRDSRTQSRGGVPYLRRLPMVGNLFGSTDNSNRRTELIVLITPRVMRSREDALDTMDELRAEFTKLKAVIPQRTSSEKK